MKFNDALLAKSAWRLLTNPDQLWVKVLKSIYFPNRSFLAAEHGPKASWAWSSLLPGRDMLLKDFCWKVENGNDISSWEDPWIPASPNCKAIPVVGAVIYKTLKVFNLISRGQWNLTPISTSYTSETITHILKIPIPMNSIIDTGAWAAANNGTYSAKLGYRLLVAQSPQLVSASTSSSASLPHDI